ncbi:MULTISPECIES: hypothetical protein [Terrabacteria group]|uniref:hypothetical protein n=1 Tax=Bacillati TaxID=1783272 RepID=UPI00193A13B7|nr:MULTISPECIES: hypothetical protein [Terrabacteria group]MBW9212051.1 hypothetical protein [Trueperella sp. zg.1013]QRG87142.1 hypothetical protein JOS54_02205 [Bulleidia sp. zg-1006]
MKRYFLAILTFICAICLIACSKKVGKDEFLVQVSLKVQNPPHSVMLVLTENGQMLTKKRVEVDVNHPEKLLYFYFNRQELKALKNMQGFAIQAYLFKTDDSKNNWNLGNAESVNGVIQFAPIYSRTYEILVEGNAKQEFWSSWQEVKPK